MESRLAHVTIYASGARVRRVTTLPAPLPNRVRIIGLPLSVIDDTVRVEVGGPAVATAVRVGVDAPEASAALPEAPEEVAVARRRVALAEADLARLGAALDGLAAARVIEADPSDGPPPPWDAVVAARTAMVELRAARVLVLSDHRASARRELEVAREALEAITDRERRGGTARAPRLHELRKYVEVDLTATAASEITIELEYLVGAARWAPSYVARLDGDRVVFEVRAMVAQDTGEDWTGISLGLSTAEPDRFAQLPELAAQKIGRRQVEPTRTGFRLPPVGADALYADYERALAPPRRTSVRSRAGTGGPFDDSTYEGVQPAPPSPPPLAGVGGYARARTDVHGEFAGEVWDEDSSRAKEAFETPPSGRSILLAAQAMPSPKAGAAPPASRSAPSRDAQKRRPGTIQPTSQPLPPTPRLDYATLQMAPPSSPARGTLIPVAISPHAQVILSEVTNAQAKLAGQALPAGCVAGWTHTYDYAYAGDGTVDVRSDGGWHSVAVTSHAGTVQIRHVAVPREQADVFRVAAIENPVGSPLLPGPIDVYDRGRFVVTSAVEFTPPGAGFEIGLGVDPSIKLARNTEYREEATGMLRGALRLIHAITIQIENLSTRSIELEVRERIPVKRDGDDDLEITMNRVEPPWERWSPDAAAPRAPRLRGGYRWKLGVAAGAKHTLRAGYEIKIAGKLELIDGNRRES